MIIMTSLDSVNGGFVSEATYQDHPSAGLTDDFSHDTVCCGGFYFKCSNTTISHENSFQVSHA